MKDEALCIIPARGGSKGIPRKNVRVLVGESLVAHAIGTARRAERVGRVIISTEDAEIADVAEQCGAEVVERPIELAGDEASSESALLHVLDHLEDTEGVVPRLTVFAQCTAPLTAPEDIDAAVDTLREEGADAVLSATPSHHFLWSRKEEEGATGVNHDEARRLRRQDREKQYLETGAVYVMRTDGFREAGHRFFGKVALYEMPPERVWEIDEPRDLAVAEALLEAQRNRNWREQLPDSLEAVVFDFDGVFTDNSVLVFQDGDEAVRCDRGDGMGIELLRKNLDVPLWVISKEQHPVLKARCEKLKIPCVHGVDDKLPLLRSWLGEQRIALDDTIFVGNDVNDIPCLRAAGCGIVVRDAHPTAQSAADIVLSRRGGNGAVRELADLILETKQSYA